MSLNASLEFHSTLEGPDVWRRDHEMTIGPMYFVPKDPHQYNDI